MGKFFVALDDGNGNFRAITNPFNTVEEAWESFWNWKKYYLSNVPYLIGTKLLVIEARVLGEEEIR